MTKTVRYHITEAEDRAIVRSLDVPAKPEPVIAGPKTASTAAAVEDQQSKLQRLRKVATEKLHATS